MVEYGNGVSGVAGQVAGGHGGGNQPVDVGTSISQFVTNSVHTFSSMPLAEQVILAVVVVIAGLFVLRRAF
jgi:hypothetical protein